MRERTFITVEEARAQLPNVGDRLIRVPTIHTGVGLPTAGPMPCIVTYVNREHLWYTVRFDTGYTQSFKVPAIRRWGA